MKNCCGNSLFLPEVISCLITIMLPIFSLILIGHAYTQSRFAHEMFGSPGRTTLLPDFTDSYGVVFRDLNTDGWSDLYVVRFRNLNRLFMNRGEGKPFADSTIQSGLGGNLMPRGQQNLELGASAVDFNNDGLPDVIIAGWGASTRLFRQHKDLNFLDITEQTELKTPLDGNGAFWADVNLDGNLDLFITDEHYPNHLYLGDGRGHFRDVSKLWGLQENHVSQGAAFSDLDGDGYPDLYVCNWFAPDRLYRNHAGKRFLPVKLPLTHLTISLNSNGVSFGDLDNDGDPDMLVTDRNGNSRLYRNDAAPGDSLRPHSSGAVAFQFTDITGQSGLRIPFPAYGSVLADFNQDGWPDIWVNTIGPNMFFENRGNARFKKTYKESPSDGSGWKYYSTGAATADLDLDGDPDLFVANKDTHSVLYRNPVNNRNFIRMKLVGVSANRDAIGAKVWLFAEDSLDKESILAGYREVSGGGGYLSQNSLNLHFGVSGGRNYWARIVFPGGRELKVPGLQAGHSYVFYEYNLPLRSFYRAYQYIYRTIGQPYFGIDLLLFLLLIGLLVGYTIFSTGRYRWANRQIIIFLLLALTLLYGIFLVLQDWPMRQRFLVQLVSLGGILGLLTFFMEKIRRLELNRLEYRRLLQDFSSELILIKENSKLYSRLAQTIYQVVRPRYCVIYVREDDKFILKNQIGNFEGPDHIRLSRQSEEHLLSPKYGMRESPLEFKEVPDGHIFPLRRNDKLYGFLVVGRAAGKRDFNKEDRAVFRTLGDQAAIATENNLYIEETRRLIQQVTEAETREKYLVELEKAFRELEEKNRRLQQLYQDLQNTQAQLVQSEKMASLGQLMAGIAHELNNPISYIYANLKELNDYAQVVKKLVEPLAGPQIDQNKLRDAVRRAKQDEDIDFILGDLKTLVDESVQGSLRVKELVQNLRNFSRVDEAERKYVDLHQGLESTLRLLTNELKGRIRVQKDYRELPQVWCNPGQINQVFMNILLNAAQAIRGKGTIGIKTRFQNDRVEIAIIDDGPGIPADAIPKIFDPFFTTKPVGQGTGLGLSISYHIVKNHGGEISVDSTEGGGTTFLITLPVHGPEGRPV